MKFPVFDLHCDTALALLGENLKQTASLKQNNCHIDLDRASTLGGYAQCFACFTTTAGKGPKPVEVFEREIDTILREMERNSQQIALAYTPQEIAQNQEKGLMSGILTIEGPAGFGFDPELLEDLHRLGFRITTLGWNEKNPLTGSHKTGGGLTDPGKTYVKEAHRLRMLVDVSHITDARFWDLMAIIQSPVIASLSTFPIVSNLSRTPIDAIFPPLCNPDRVAAPNLFPDIFGVNPNLDTVCDHIFHFLTLAPTGKHIALGGDLDGIGILPEGFTGVQDYEKLAERLLERGLSEQQVRDIFWNNAMGVMQRCCT